MAVIFTTDVHSSFGKFFWINWIKSAIIFRNFLNVHQKWLFQVISHIEQKKYCDYWLVSPEVSNSYSYNTLLLYTVLCYWIQYSVIGYSTLLFEAVLWYCLQCSVVVYSAQLLDTVLIYCIQCSVVIYSTLLFYTVLCYGIQYSVIIYSTLLLYTMLCYWIVIAICNSYSYSTVSKSN